MTMTAYPDRNYFPNSDRSHKTSGRFVNSDKNRNTTIDASLVDIEWQKLDFTYNIEPPPVRLKTDPTR